MEKKRKMSWGNIKCLSMFWSLSYCTPKLKTFFCDHSMVAPPYLKIFFLEITLLSDTTNGFSYPFLNTLTPFTFLAPRSPFLRPSLIIDNKHEYKEFFFRFF